MPVLARFGTILIAPRYSKKQEIRPRTNDTESYYIKFWGLNDAKIYQFYFSFDFGTIYNRISYADPAINRFSDIGNHQGVEYIPPLISKGIIAGYRTEHSGWMIIYLLQGLLN